MGYERESDVATGVKVKRTKGGLARGKFAPRELVQSILSQLYQDDQGRDPSQALGSTGLNTSFTGENEFPADKIIQNNSLQASVQARHH